MHLCSSKLVSQMNNGSQNANTLFGFICYTVIRIQKQEDSAMKEKGSFISWVKNHKTELLIAGVTVVGTVLVVKNWDSIKDMFMSAEPIIPEIVEVEPAVNDTVVPILSSDILDNLTGNNLTARALGDKVWCSAQAINKRIVAAGLATRLPCGEYMMTEAGRMLGKDTWKTTAAGHSFSNIEWDEKVLEVIFSPEELREIAAKQEQARRILAA